MVILAVASTPIFALESENNLVATINGVEITLPEFYDRLEQEAGTIILGDMILDELVKQKQAELDIYVEPEVFAAVFSDIITQLGGEQGYYYYLMQSGFTDERFREQIEFELLLTMLAQAEITVTAEEVIEFFQENEEYFDQPQLRQISHILVETEAEAQNIINLLDSGAIFEELAIEHSLDQDSAPNGGLLGYLSSGMVVESFDELAWSLEIDSYDKVETEYGWHIILVTDELEAIPADLNEQWDIVEQTLTEHRASDLEAYIQKLEQEADIVIHRDRYQQ